jgi:hypothetical protein
LTAIAPSSPSWLSRLDRRAVVAGVVAVVVGYLPLTMLGPGTDLDVGGVYHAGRSILDGGYQVSRLPGAPVFEATTAVLHAVGGSLLVNLVSVLAAATTALAVARLIDREGHAHASWYGLAVLLNPFVWVAGTSMVDFLWATALVLVGANLQLSRRFGPAVVLYALAAGCRLSTLVLVAAVLVADLVANPPVRRRVVLTGVATAVLTTVVYLPPFLQLGADFLRSEVPVSSLWVQIGRFGAKNTFFFGPITIVLVLWHLPRVLGAVPHRWTTSVVLRVGLIGFVASQVLFLRFPWKLAHLIPSLLCLVLVLAASGVLSRRGVAVLVAAQLVLGAVTLNLAQPDRPNEATGGRIALGVIEGVWIRDLRCRLDGDRDAYRRAGEVDALLDTWSCVIPWSDGRPTP